jgi:RNase adapter protein RapZ
MVDLFIVIISGLSGSGKSHAIKCFEDIGYFCVDNLPPALLPKFVDLCSQSGQQIPRIAVGIDIRERAFFRDFADVFKGLREGGMQVELLFFEADNASIMRRFSESRRPHPLAPDRPVLDGIRLERERLSELRNMADRIIDTTAITVHQLKDMIQDRYRMIGAGTGLHVAIVSFGFKFGIPYDADLLFDVRFIKNPNFAPTLQNFTSMDP